MLIELTEEEKCVLEEIRQKYGLESLEQALTWLIRQRLAKAEQLLIGSPLAPAWKVRP